MSHGRLAVTAALLLLAPTGVAAQAHAPEQADSALLGHWQVDLRPTPDAEDYFQPFVVDSIRGNAMWGRFYGTPIEDGRLNRDWGTIRFAFVTRDGSGPYHHAGRVVGDRLEGTTLSIGREFLAVWTAARQPVPLGPTVEGR